MPNFTPRPPTYEARPYTGGPASTLDIQGWLLASKVQSQHVDATADSPESIKFEGKTLEAGQWLICKDGELQVIGTSELFTQYMQTQ